MLVSLLGLLTPPFFAILAIAIYLKSANPKVIECLNTITIAVIVLVGASFVEIAGVCLRSGFTLLIFILTVLMFAFTDIQPVVIIILLSIFGVLIKTISRKYKEVEK